MKRNMGASIDNKTRRAVYERDGFRCALCDSTDGLQIHHVKPRGEGGADHPMNLITLCWRCHAAAHGDFFYSSPDMFDRSLLGNASVEKWNVRRWLIESMELECVRYVSDYYAERGGRVVPVGRVRGCPSPFFSLAVAGMNGASRIRSCGAAAPPLRPVWFFWCGGRADAPPSRRAIESPGARPTVGRAALRAGLAGVARLALAPPPQD